MSLFYAESNNENAKELFYKRTIYKGNMITGAPMNLVNFNFGEKFLYGRVDRNYIPMILDLTNPNMFLKSYQAPNSGESLKGVNFVVDAFTHMVDQFNKCLATGKLNESDKYLSSLRVHKALEDPMLLYNRHRNTYYESIKKEIRARDIPILDFDDFMRELMFLLNRSAKEYPFTLPAFVKNKRCPINASGLVVEIADLKCDNDKKKVEEFVNSPNWEFYVQTCNAYGFMVDQNVPWRIVCDLASPTCLAEDYNFDSVETILRMGYRPAPLVYFENFVNHLYTLYQLVRTPLHLSTVECENGDMQSMALEGRQYTREELMKHYSEDYFRHVYFQIRLMEESTEMDAQEQQFLIEEAMEFAHADSSTNAILTFEKIINKPFDYAGSLSYNVKHMKALEQKPDEIQEILAAEEEKLAKQQDADGYEGTRWVPGYKTGLGLFDVPGALD